MKLEPMELSKTEEIIMKFFDLQCQKTLTGHMLKNANIEISKDVISQGIHMIFKTSMATEVLQETEKEFTIEVDSDPYPASLSDCVKLYLRKKLGGRLGTKKFKINMITKSYQKSFYVKFERVEAYPRLNVVYSEEVIGQGVRKERIYISREERWFGERTKRFDGDIDEERN